MAYLAILTTQRNKVLAVVSESGSLPVVYKETVVENAEEILDIKVYDPKTGLGWLLINEHEENFVILIPEPVKLVEPFKWVPNDEQSQIDETSKLVLMKIVRSL